MPMKSTDTRGCYTEALLGQLFGVNYLNVAADTLLTMFAIKLSAGLCVKKKNTLKDVVGVRTTNLEKIPDVLNKTF